MSDRTLSLGIIHTSPATVDLFARLVRDALPGTRIVNMLDDSILPELRDNGGDLSAVEPRWTEYAKIMAARNVDLILNACSSIGELCERVAPIVPVDIVRVDSAMAREAVSRGCTISVVATLQTTLRPTVDLIQSLSQAHGKAAGHGGAAIASVLVSGAYEALMSGDGARHDELIRATLETEAQTSDVVVLAQASMARVAGLLPPALQAKILASPPFAVADIVARLTSL